MCAARSKEITPLDRTSGAKGLCCEATAQDANERGIATVTGLTVRGYSGTARLVGLVRGQEKAPLAQRISGASSNEENKSNAGMQSRRSGP